MTPLTTPLTPAAAQPPATRPAVPWRKLAWVTWRQHRLALAGAGALLGGACLVMLISGLGMRSSLQTLRLINCHPAAGPACATAIQLFQEDHTTGAHLLATILLVIPLLVGAFTGGPLIAREFEAGTVRFAWTQGAGRTRLVVAKLALLGLLLTAAGVLFSLMFSWWYQPLFDQGGSLMTTTAFTLSGTVFAAWTLGAFAIAVLAGTLTRRTVPAMAAALVVTVGLFGFTELYLRPHYLAAQIIRGAKGFPPRAWSVRTWFTNPHGQYVSNHTINQLAPRMMQRYLQSPAGRHAPGKPSVAQLWQLLGQDGYTHWASYQPESRFWPFQLIQTGWLVALAVLLSAATVWLIRRRAA